MATTATGPARAYLFFVTKPYSVSILEPLQDYILNQTAGSVRWFTAGSAETVRVPGDRLRTSGEVQAYRPDAIIVPGNVVPHFWPGLKVQVFHGLGEEKPGHYRVTGFFDLYCTPGPWMTAEFLRRARGQRRFLVRETGWPKLDPLVRPVRKTDLCRQLGLDPGNPILLYAPTFSSRYASARALLPAFRHLRDGPCQVLVKFHDLMDQAVVRQYRELQGRRLTVIDTHDAIPLLQVADLLITDTSSIAYEYMLLDRPIITYRAGVRKDKGLNITHPGQLLPAIEDSLAEPQRQARQRARYLAEIHPYRDGESSRRVVAAVEQVLSEGRHLALPRRSLNWIRKYRMRRMVP